MTSQFPAAQNNSAVARLRAELSAADNIVVGPGVYDGLTARIALRAGFNCLYMTGAGTTMSRLGMPDIGLATLNDMRDNAGMIAGLEPSVPLVADADTGYGGPVMVGRTVKQYIQAGVAALHLEDQVHSKRCGHLLNKQLVDEAEFFSRIRAAVMARDESKGDIVIIARTDALQELGYETARDRLKGAIAIGADVAFLEGLTSIEQGRQICQDLAPTPVLFNCVAGGLSPTLSVQEAKDLGFKMIIFPGLLLGPVTAAATVAATTLKSQGSVENNGGSPKTIFELCGIRNLMAFDVAAGGKMYEKGI